MTQVYQAFQKTVTIDSGSDPDVDVQTQSEEEFPADQNLSIDEVVNCLIRSGLRHPLYADQVVESLKKIANSCGSAPLLESVIRVMEKATHMYRRSHRLMVYEAISKVIDAVPFENRELSISSSSIKSFAIRLIGDVDKSTKPESDATIRYLTRLISILCLSSFRDLAVSVLLTPEFVLGRPTVSSVLVVDALIDLFSIRADKSQFSEAVVSIVGRFETVPSLRGNDLLLTAFLKGVHRTGLVAEIVQEVEPSIKFLYENVEEIESPESLETALYLLSCMSNSIFDTVLRKREIQEAIMLLGSKGLENDDCRQHFTDLVSVLWSKRIKLFSESRSMDLMKLVLVADAPGVWPLGEAEVVVPFLCDNFGKPDDGIKRLVISALEAIAREKRGELSQTILDLIHSKMITEEEIVRLNPDCIVGVLKLIRAIDGSLVSSLMVSYIEKFVCAPATAMAVRFPQGVMEGDLDRIRAHARDCLLHFSLKMEKHINATDLLGHLLECLEHMPSAGIATVCEAVVLLVSRDVRKRMPPSQGFIVLLWLLISIELHVHQVEAVMSCLVSISGLIHHSLEGLWEPRLKGKKDFAFKTEFAFAMHAIEFGSREEKDRFLSLALETLIALLPPASTVPQVKTLLIIAWEHVMDLLVPDQSISTFTNRVLELLAIEEAVTASSECVIATAAAVGRLADRRFDAVLELLSRMHSQSETALMSLGGLLPGGSVSNSLRIKANKSSFRGLFAFESTERRIEKTLRIKEIGIRGIGFAIEASPKNRLSDLRTKECVSSILVNEIRVEISNLTNWLSGGADHDHQLSVHTLIGAIESVERTARAIDGCGDVGAIDMDFFPVKFAEESISQLLQLLDLVSSSPQFPLEPVLHAIAALVGCRYFSISSDRFGEVLEQTLQALVHSVPDNPGALNAASEEAIRLASRCQASALVVKSLMGHARSWLGFSRLARAVFALGGSGPLPLVRWVCVRIVSALAEETDVVRSDADTEQFLEVISTLVPRLHDTYPPVRDLSIKLVNQLLIRWRFTKDIAAANTAVTGNDIISIAQVVPDEFVVGYALNLLCQIHDSDSGPSVVEAIRELLSLRSSAVSSPEAAETLVESILTNSAITSTPLLPRESKIRLLESLRFIAAVWFPVAIRQVLSGDAASDDKTLAIQAFVRDKSTLLHLTKELVDRLNSPDLDSAVRASFALGAVMDCYEDSGVAGIAVKFFSALFLSLLILLWRVKNVPDLVQREGIKLVVHKLCRAACIEPALPSSFSTESALTTLLCDEHQNRSLIPVMRDFLNPFLLLVDKSCGQRRQAAIVLAAQLADPSLTSVFIQICEDSGSDEGSVETLYSIKGLRLVLTSKSLVAGGGYFESFLTIFSTNIASTDSCIVSESLRCISLLLETSAPPFDSSSSLATFVRCVAHLRRVVDHSDPIIRAEAFKVLARICNTVAASDVIDSGDTDPKLVSNFFSAISDLWIPCIVRSQDLPQVAANACKAFEAILNAAISDQPVKIPIGSDLSFFLDIVRSEVSESPIAHLNSCSYYLLGMPSVSEPVAVAAARLISVLSSLISEPSAETLSIVAGIVEQLLLLAKTFKPITPLIAGVVIGGQPLN